MLHRLPTQLNLFDQPHRRELLRLGAVGLSLGLPSLLRAEAKPSPKLSVGGKAKSVILFFLHGGQSHIDTFDMKPEAADKIRGEFSPIPSAVAGLQVCEHLPKLAKLAKKYSLIRSMSHKFSNHNPGTTISLTGSPPARDIVTLTAGPDDHPHPGAVITKLAPTKAAVPNFVQLSPPVFGDAFAQVAGQNAGFLGSQYDPIRISGDPGDPKFDVEELTLPDKIDEKRFARRRKLLEAVESEFPLIRESPQISAMDRYYQRAYELVTSKEARQAFDMSKEKPETRERYGKFPQGQQLLLARRLVEAGVRLVSVYWGGLLNVTEDYWDTHKKNFPKQKETLLPQFDQCLSALIEDLDERKLLDSTLVVVIGEFGRTPRIGQITANAATDGTGRDHWPQCYTALIAGGGVQGGAIIGKSDKIGAFPVDRPTGPDDLVATIHYSLGIDWNTEIHDRQGRPSPACRGEPVKELFS